MGALFKRSGLLQLKLLTYQQYNREVDVSSLRPGLQKTLGCDVICTHHRWPMWLMRSNASIVDQTAGSVVHPADPGLMDRARPSMGNTPVPDSELGMVEFRYTGGADISIE